jgi:hypothetical protein
VRNLTEMKGNTMTTATCPYSGGSCPTPPGSWPDHEVVAISVGSDEVMGLRLGGTVRLADLGKAVVCPLVEGKMYPEAGDKVPVETNAGGVATRIGATSLQPCATLHPWG